MLVLAAAVGPGGTVAPDLAAARARAAYATPRIHGEQGLRRSHPELVELETVTRPAEVAAGLDAPVLRLVYGEDPADPTFDRVLRETVGGTNASGQPAGGTRYFEYIRLPSTAPPGTLSEARGMVRVTEPNGNVEELLGNELGMNVGHRTRTRGLRAGEPAYHEVRTLHDPEGRRVLEVFPEGNAASTPTRAAPGPPSRTWSRSPSCLAPAATAGAAPWRRG